MRIRTTRGMYVLLWAVTAVLLFASCRSSKTAVATAPTGTPAATVEKMIVHGAPERLDAAAVTTKVNVEAEADGRKLSVSGNLKMKRGDVIQLSLVAFGFIEAGRLELTKDYLLVIDRLKKRYVKVAYADVGFLRDAGITFDSFQALFWNELFVPKKSGGISVDDFVVRESDSRLELEARTDSRLACRFMVDVAQALLTQTVVSDVRNTSGPALRWEYGQFEGSSGGQFPRRMDISLEGLGKNLRLGLALGNIKADAKWETRTQVSSKYKEVSISSILKHIIPE
ncbi:MAG: DUF4292 domain-containing protein [Paraprevotella sp.]|nr:DUF4292 domain-containing protein [Paraprevotella sp.]